MGLQTHFSWLLIVFGIYFYPLDSNASLCPAPIQNTLKRIFSHSRSFDVSSISKAADEYALTITDPEQWIGKSYTFEEAVAIVDHHLRLVRPEAAKDFDLWLENIAKKNKIKVKASKKKIKNATLSHPLLLQRIIGRKDKIKWAKEVVKNEKDLFNLESKVINILSEAQYNRLVGLNVFAKKPNHFFTKNFKLIEQNILYQYLVGGEKNLPKNILLNYNEPLSVVKNILGISKGGIVKFSPIHRWILNKYGISGLQRYIYVRNGPVAALKYSLNALSRIQLVAMAGIAVVLSPRFNEIYDHYHQSKHPEDIPLGDINKAEEILEKMEEDPQSVIDQSRKILFEDVKQDASQLTGNDLANGVLPDSMSLADKKGLYDMLDAVQAELDSTLFQNN